MADNLHVKREMSFKELKNEHRLAHMKGKQLYALYGTKRGECLFLHSVEFPDGKVIEAEMCAGKENELPEWRVLLLEHGNVLADVSEDYGQEVLLDVKIDDEESGKTYRLEVTAERCGVPIWYTDSEGKRQAAYIDSDWLIKWAKSENVDILEFLDDYDKRGTASLIKKAVKDGAVAFFHNPDDRNAPFEFEPKSAWKFRAFAEVYYDLLPK